MPLRKASVTLDVLVLYWDRHGFAVPKVNRKPNLKLEKVKGLHLIE